MPGTADPHGRRARRQLKTLINRRAYELAQLAYYVFIEEMKRELEAGRLREDRIEGYMPTALAEPPLSERWAP
jgi:hypothetical protein